MKKSGFQNCRIAGIDVSSEDYHGNKAERGTAGYRMSPSALKVFTECPSRWKAGYQTPSSEAKNFGNLLDCLLLTPEQFDRRYVLKPLEYPDVNKKGETVGMKRWNGNANWCKEWLEEHSDRMIVSRTEFDAACTARDRMISDETIKAFLDCSKRQVHVVGEWRNETGIVVPVECLIDLVPDKESEFQKCLGDLKTTRNASRRAFGRWCYAAGYHVQAAFDLDLYMSAVNPDSDPNGEDRVNWAFLLCENFPPYQPGRRLMAESFVTIGRQTYRSALGKYASCLASGSWPGYDAEDEFGLIEAEPWMEFDAMSSAMEMSQEVEAEYKPGDDLLATA